MRFSEGNKKGAGRKVGSKNKTTQEVRDILRLLLENNLDTLQEKLDEVGEKSPAKYVELIFKLTEYVIPKISPTQVVSYTEGQTYKIEFQE